MSETIGAGATWYHGSPVVMDLLREGSTITQMRSLAEAFSHKPAILSISDGGDIKHTGADPGYLYYVAEEVGPDDVRPIPRSTMPAGYEWRTSRPLRLALIGPVSIKPQEVLTPEEIDELRCTQRDQGERT